MTQRGFTLWFTGLSGAGKSTLAERVKAELNKRGLTKVELLDGDVVRENLSKGLGFSKEDRDTNIKRIGFVCNLLTRNGVIALAAAISPYRETRDFVREMIGENFVEVFVKCPIEVCIQRDTKGLYAKALRGEILEFTGISDPYEPPLSPEVIVETDKEPIDLSLQKILQALELLKLIPLQRDTSLQAETHRAVIGQLIPTSREIIGFPPHGGKLINRLLGNDEREKALSRISHLKSITLTDRELSDVEMIAVGGYSPLKGFMSSAEYRSVIDTGRLINGLAWTIPITLSVKREEAQSFKVGEDIVLKDKKKATIAILHLEEKYEYDKGELAQKVWQTTDTAHPGVKTICEQGEILFAGEVDVINLPQHTDFRPALRDRLLTPAQTRVLFAERGWKSIVAFQTRNPVHRAHEFIQKVALEIVDGLLLHPLVGETKGDDIPAEVRMECYRVLLENYYPEERVVFAVMPAAMRYAGPKEAILHAIIRQNYGCTHFIVGRDHAGVGNYYGSYDAHHIFDEYSKEELLITPLKFDHTFYCKRCDGMASTKTCPHDDEQRVILSGTKVRELLSKGILPPPEFTRPEVAKILIQAYYALKETV